MKLLFYRNGSICEPDIIEAMESLGHEVACISNEVYDKTITPQQTIRLLQEALNSSGYDAVFSINFYPVIAEVCDIYHIRYICQSVDSPVLELFSHSIVKEWNRIFLFDNEQFRELSAYNPEHIFYLPLATNINRWDKLLYGASADNSGRYTHDIAFVGSLYTEKSPYDSVHSLPPYISGYLNGLMAAQLQVYGSYFLEELLPEDVIAEYKKHYPDFYNPGEASFLTDRKILAQFYIGNKISSMERTKCMKVLSSRHDVDIYTGSDTSNFPRLRNHGFARTHSEMPLIFNRSKINLNITSKAIRSAIPLRIWDILGCGGFCLTNYQSELADYFVPGEHLDYYDSMESLMEKTEYYLSHDKERRDIAENGRELIRSGHTWTYRVELMLETAFSI